MDKKTRRGNRDPTMHPTKGLQEAAKRQHPDANVGDTFLPLTGEAPPSLDKSHPAAFMRVQIQIGNLKKWELGMCNQHIATRAQTGFGQGLVDILISPDPTDRNWVGLVEAQQNRLVELYWKEAVFEGALRRIYDEFGLAPTVSTTSAVYVWHDGTQARLLQLRELARLQGLPDNSPDCALFVS